MSIPHRFDLEIDSRINLAIQKFNKKLRNIMQHFNHVSIMETDMNRKHYTNHGLHLNKKGKDVLARIGNLINKLLFEEDKGNTIITLNWNSDITKYAITQVAHCIPRNSTLENSDKTMNRNSTRQKKQPVTRKNYFLWPKL